MTEERLNYVSFSVPFSETGLVLLISNANKEGITSFSALADQTAIKYGLLNGGSTYALFRDSTDPTLKKMWDKMNEEPTESFVTSLTNGSHKVKTQPFALVVEKSFAEYITGKDCDLTYIEDIEQYNPRAYAIALAKGSPHLDKFNKAINVLKSSGQLENLRNRYWKKCGVLSGVTIRVSLFLRSECFLLTNKIIL